MATQADTTNSTASKRTRGASPDELAVVAQRAQAFTNASGVAIALSEGNVDEIVCRARSGASAPDVGAALRIEGTFTGLCIQSGKELRCDDCETDTRVDMAAIRALGIRSMVATPIREENRVVGVLAAFAPTPHAFTITHVAVLKTMADQISVLLQKERRTRDEGGSPVETPRPATPAIMARPVVTPMPVAPPVVIKSSPASQAASPAFAKVEPIRGTPLEVVPLATPPKAEKRADLQRASFDTFGSIEEEKQPGGKLMVVGVVAVLIIAAAGTFTFLKIQKSGASSAQNVPANQSSGNQPSANEFSSDQSSASQPSGSQPSGNQANQFSANQPTTGTPANSGQAGSAANFAAFSGTAVIAAANPGSKSTAEIDGKKTGSKVAPDKTFTDRPAATDKQADVATLGASGTSRIARGDTTQPSVAESAPTFTVVSENTGAPLTSLARPSATSAPTAAAIEQSQLEPLQLIRAGTPVYPAIAKARSITGVAVVQATVGKDGRVTNLKFISGQPIFRDAAFDAVRQYQFKAAKLNGQPIEQTTQIKISFH
jgi:TonB family protein